MKILTAMILMLVTSLSALAQDNEVTCKVKLNSQLIYDFTLASPEGKKIVIGEFDGYKVFLNHAGNSHFTLEIFDGNQLMRTYSDAPLRNLDDEITSTIWTRDALFEASCKLHK